MILLAIDTSAHLSAACLYDSKAGKVIAEDCRDIGRGHAEILMGQIGNCLQKSGRTYRDIKRVGVACGPGSFTGIRVGMATARGLGLGLSIPVIGLSCLDACETTALAGDTALPLLSVLDAKRGQVFCKLSSGTDAWIANAGELPPHLPDDLASLAGSGAKSVQEVLGLEASIMHEEAAAPIDIYARLAAEVSEAEANAEPIYLRSADAKPQTGFALEREPA